MLDLHIHSNYSDGAFSIPSVVSRIIESKCKYVALTDHDTVKGIPEFLYSIARFASEINTISGVEITSIIEDIPIHILGYNINWNDSALIDLLDGVYRSRIQRAIGVLRIAQEYGFHVQLQDLTAIANNAESNIGKPHIARALINDNNSLLLIDLLQGEKPTVSNVIGLMQKGNVFHVKKIHLNFVDVINAIHMAGGFAVLAHPNEYMSTDTFKNTIPKLIKHGIDGIECFFSKSNKEFSGECLKVIENNKLLLTSGSDFHGLDDREIGKIDYYGFNVKDLLNITIQRLF